MNKQVLVNIRAVLSRGYDIKKYVDVITKSVDEEMLNSVMLMIVKKLWADRVYAKKMLSDKSSGICAVLEFFQVPHRYIYGDDYSGLIVEKYITIDGSEIECRIDLPAFYIKGMFRTKPHPGRNFVELPRFKFSVMRADQIARGVNVLNAPDDSLPPKRSLRSYQYERIINQIFANNAEHAKKILLTKSGQFRRVPTSDIDLLNKSFPTEYNKICTIRDFARENPDKSISINALTNRGLI